MIEIINRLNYERYDKNNGLSLDEGRFDKRNHNFDKKELCDRIFNHCAVVPNYNSLDLFELYWLCGALEELFISRDTDRDEELLSRDAGRQHTDRHDADALRNNLSRDNDIRLFKKCLFHPDNGEVLLVRDITKLMPYAFNLNLMLLDHAREIIDRNLKIPFSSMITEETAAPETLLKPSEVVRVSTVDASHWCLVIVYWGIKIH